MTDLHRPWLEQGLQVGWYLDWQGHTYRIRTFDAAKLVLHVEHLVTAEVRSVPLETLLLSSADDSAPLFAPSLPALEHQRRRQRPAFTSAPADDLPVALLQRADQLIHLVQTVECRVKSLLAAARLHGDTLLRKGALEQALGELDEPVSQATYYRSLACYRTNSGDRGRIAASFHRRSFNQTRMNTAQQHFVDTLILRFYARQPPIRPSTLYKLALAAWKRTGGQWLDPQRCSAAIPQDLVAELLNPAVPLTHITDAPDKRRLLTAIDLPSRSWWYAYLRWFEQQPEQGKQVMTARHGKEMWEHEHMVFDTFVTRTAFPLHYVFADHWLLDVFVVDEATRSQPVRLWLTVLLDAYSRCVLGMTLLPEAPCIELIQQALQHALWPKTSHRALGWNRTGRVTGFPSNCHWIMPGRITRTAWKIWHECSVRAANTPVWICSSVRRTRDVMARWWSGSLATSRSASNSIYRARFSRPIPVMCARRLKMPACCIPMSTGFCTNSSRLPPYTAPRTGWSKHPTNSGSTGWRGRRPCSTPNPRAAASVLALVTANTGDDHQRHPRIWHDLLVTGFPAHCPGEFQGETLRFRFRYDPNDISQIALFHETGGWAI